jgi:chromosome segregation ATPase
MIPFNQLYKSSYAQNRIIGKRTIDLKKWEEDKYESLSISNNDYIEYLQQQKYIYNNKKAQNHRKEIERIKRQQSSKYKKLYEARIQKKVSTIENQQNEIVNLNVKLKQNKLEIKELKRNSVRNMNKIKDLNNRIKELQYKINRNQNKLEQKTSPINVVNLKNQINSYKINMNKLANQLMKNIVEQSKIKNQLINTETKLEQQNVKLVQQKNQLDTQSYDLNSMISLNKNLKDQIKKKNIELRGLKQKIRKQVEPTVFKSDEKDYIEIPKTMVKKINADIEDLESTVNALNKKEDKLKKEIDKLKKENIKISDDLFESNRFLNTILRKYSYLLPIEDEYIDKAKTFIEDQFDLIF